MEPTFQSLPRLRKAHAASLILAALITSAFLSVSVWGILKAYIGVGLIAAALAALLCFVGWRGAISTWNAPEPLQPPSRVSQWLVLSAFPAAMLGSVFDCGGFSGCTELCGLLNTRWLPLVSLLVFVHLIRPWAASLLLVTLSSFALLIPHCQCYNVANRTWIDLIGSSPACFAGSFAVGVVTVGAVSSGRYLRTAGLIGWITALALAAFALGHHRFGWPW